MRAISHKLRLSTATLLAMVLGSYVFAANAEAQEGRDISRVNSTINVEADESVVGDVSSVNGSVRLARGSSASEVTTVNGRIEISDQASVYEAATVNGGIRVGENVTVRGSLETVNGGIRTESGTVIENRIETVNGGIRVSSTQVGDNIETSNGDINIQDGSVIEGDVVVKGRKRWWDRLFSWNNRRPEITIDSSSTVRGDIHIYREVDLNIADGSLNGEVVEHF
ncbi:MAG: hypothetical protein GKR91_04410 [Pseudomonadales bacterium]|nr:hypothetical protein [Pseudomonadales bacterium]